MDSELWYRPEAGREEFPADTGNIKGTAARQPACSPPRVTPRHGGSSAEGRLKAIFRCFKHALQGRHEFFVPRAASLRLV
jgi:hypothetical protein